MLPGRMDAWRGVLLRVPDAHRPGLRIEAAPPRHLRIVQDGEPLLWAVIADDHSDMSWCRSGSWLPIVPAITADETRRLAANPGARWWQSWAHGFVERLEHSSTAPLYPGTWVLRPAAMTRDHPAADAASAEVVVERVWSDPDLLAAKHMGELDWFSEAGGLLPLRELPAADDGRVKAYRKQVREGSIAPVLAWWINPLACHVILDGHARLVASLSEDSAPPLLALTAIRDPDEVPPDATGEAFYEARREGIYAHGGAGTRHAAAIEQVIAEAQLRREEQATTRGWLMDGGLAAWEREVASRVPGWQRTGIDSG